jgi:CRISPR-associated exonuclease Cas4
LKYYLYYLGKRGVENIRGEIDYPQLKQKLKIQLAEEDIKEMEAILREIAVLVKAKTPPGAVKTKICKDCSYYELCFI